MCTEANLIIPGLYLGSMVVANDEIWLKQHKITHVLGLVIDQKRFPNIKYLTYNIGDSPFQDIITSFGDCFRFINDSMNSDGNILVHCRAGMSRSSTIVIGYIMYTKNSSLRDTIIFIKNKREIVFPNYGFILQLKTFERLNKLLREEFLKKYRSL